MILRAAWGALSEIGNEEGELMRGMRCEGSWDVNYTVNKVGWWEQLVASSLFIPHFTPWRGCHLDLSAKVNQDVQPRTSSEPAALSDCSVISLSAPAGLQPLLGLLESSLTPSRHLSSDRASPNFSHTILITSHFMKVLGFSFPRIPNLKKK